jgi:beta-1,4-N-acetylglucosaminyltransferase
MRALALALALACVNVFLWIVRNLARPLRARWCAKERLRALIVLGSGGHTSEMLSLLERLPADSYAPRTYVVAKTDDKSASKAMEHERRRSGASASVVRIGRAREVGQSFVTSASTTAFALVEAVALVRRCAPDVVFCNGPGTCVPVVFAAMLRRALGWPTPAVIFIESACRTRTLSLTGKILYHLRCVDAMYVMWERVHERYARTEFIGRAF